MKTIEYKNSFHNTSVRVRVADENSVSNGNGQQTRLSRSQQRRVQKALCGMHDCMCPLGIYLPLDESGWCEGGIEIGSKVSPADMREEARLAGLELARMGR